MCVSRSTRLRSTWFFQNDQARPEPNLELLNNALLQTSWPRDPLAPETWRRAVAERLVGSDWSRVVADVQPFVESRDELGLLVKERVLDLLR